MTGISTNLIHNKTEGQDVIPPINVSTTYKYSENPDEYVKDADRDAKTIFHDGPKYYSRLTHANSELVERALGKILDGNVVVYNSGLSAFFAALTHINPKRIMIGQAYHGCHGITKIFKRLNGLEILSLDDVSNFDKLQPGDLVHLETPVNPHGTNFDIEFYANKAHEKGAVFMVDSTFAPPPLQNPFNHGADIVMHSATKYFGGHSDLLAGVLVTKSKDEWYQLLEDRIFLGTNIGNLEASMLFRSLKTYELRINKQSENATALVKYLVDNKDKFSGLNEVFHGSVQSNQLTNQITKHSPTFSITMKTEDLARKLPSKLQYFIHATSLGGVESLIEWRAISDATIDPTLLRVSVGVENIEDLISDFEQALS